MIELVEAPNLPSLVIGIHLLSLMILAALSGAAYWLARRKNYDSLRWSMTMLALTMAISVFMGWLLPTPTEEIAPLPSGTIWYNAAFRADVGFALVIIVVLLVVGILLSRAARSTNPISWAAAAIFAGVPLLIWLARFLMALINREPGPFFLPLLGAVILAGLAFVIVRRFSGGPRLTALLVLSLVTAIVQWSINAYLDANSTSLFDPSGAVPFIIPLLAIFVGVGLGLVIRPDLKTADIQPVTLVRVGMLFWLLALAGFIMRFMGHYDYEGTYGFNMGLVFEAPLTWGIQSIAALYYTYVPRALEAEANVLSLAYWNALMPAGFMLLGGLWLLYRYWKAPVRIQSITGGGFSLRQRRYILAAVLVMPALLLRLFTTLYPFAQTSLLSLQRYNPAFPPTEYVATRNFERMANDLVVRESLEFTLSFVFVSTFFQMVLGIAIAHLLNAKFALRDTSRTISLIPWAIPMVVAAIGFRWMFDEDFGMIPYIILWFTGIETSWLINPDNARTAVIIVNIWKSTPFIALIMLAGLQGISEDLYEAARVDGSTPLQSLWYITLPMLLPIIVSTTMYMLVWQLAIFDLPFVMTGGGPGFSTTLIAQKIYLEINSLNYSYAAALSMVLVVIVAFIGALGLYIFRRVEVDS